MVWWGSEETSSRVTKDQEQRMQMLQRQKQRVPAPSASPDPKKEKALEIYKHLTVLVRDLANQARTYAREFLMRKWIDDNIKLEKYPSELQSEPIERIAQWANSLVWTLYNGVRYKDQMTDTPLIKSLIKKQLLFDIVPTVRELAALAGTGMVSINIDDLKE